MTVRFGLGSRVGLGVRAGAGSAWTPASVSGLWAWLDPSDAATVTRDGSNLVSNLACKLGTNLTAVTATGTERPLWVAANIGGLAALRYDGVDDWLVGAYGSTLAQPSTVFCVARNIAVGSHPTEHYVFDASAPGTARNVLNYYATGTKYQLFAGIGFVSAKTWAYGTAEVVGAQFNGTSSYVWDGLSKGAAGNAGTQGSIGLTLARRFAAFGGNNYAGNIDLGELLVYQGDVSDGDAATIIGYLQAKWGV